MLLNTDMYLADIETKMTRSQFVKNTMTTIRQTLAELAPETLERPTILPGRSNSLVPLEADGRLSVDQDDRRPSIRASFKPPPRSESNASALTSVSATKDCGPLVKAPFDGPQRAWEAQVESVLKDFYASIKEERLPLFGGSPDANNSTPPPHTLASQSSLSVMAGVLRRSPSVLSKAPSETPSSIRGRTTENPPRASTSGGTGDRQHQSSRWTSKSRSRPRGTAAGTAGGAASSSRTSFDDGGSLWSPAGSSAAWSRYSLGRTQTSMSMDSFGSAWPRNANGSATTVGYDRYPASIGFANALSQAIIREENTVGGGHFGPLGSEPSLISADDGAGTTPRPLLDDESLELAGPPWIKEGIVVHKHHLDGVDKKAKDRNWTEVFAVIQKGHMSLFSFAAPSKSLRNKSRFGGSSRHNAGAGHSNQLLSPSSAMSGAGGGVIVGGGNWQSNATNVGSFSLRQTLASVLPPPGYSRQRPHVWALSLPTGAVHLFQCGTPEVAREFVATANYWAARLSTHPLVGAISNVEYGWGDAIVNNPLVAAINDQGPASPTPRPPSSSRGFGIGGSRPGSSAGTSGPLSGLVGAGRQSMQSARASLRSAGGGGDFRPGSRTGSRHGTSSLPPSSSYGYGTHGSVTAASGYPRGPQHSARGSNASSTFSSHGHHGVHLPHGLGHSHGSLPGDRVHISDWTPPTQSMRASTRCEADQLDALLAYVRSIEEELQTHNRLRSPMLLAFSPRSSAGAKAMANWEKKSAYLLREIVKFRTYVDALSGAATRREEVYEERRREERAKNPGLACKSSPSVAAVERENGDAASTAQEHEDHVSRRGNNDNVSDLSDDEAAPAAHEVSPTTATTPKMPSVPAPPLPVPGAPPVPAAYAAQMAREAREREAEAGSDEEQGDVTLRPT